MVQIRKAFLLSMLLFQCSLASDLPRISVRPTYVGPHKVVTGGSRSIPSYSMYVYRGHDFSLEISLTTKPEVTLQPSLYAIICLWEDGSVECHHFDPAKLVVLSSTEASYTLSLSTEHGTKLDLFLVWREDVPDNPPLTKRVFKRTSNRQQVHLTIPEASEPK